MGGAEESKTLAEYGTLMITDPEFQSQSEKAKELATKLFNLLDKDSNGQLDAKEIAEMFPCFAGVFDHLIKTHNIKDVEPLNKDEFDFSVLLNDDDSDNQLNPQEFQDLLDHIFIDLYK